MTRKTALITGASRGIGAACARALAPSHDLILTARDEGALQAVAGKLTGTKTTLLAADLATAAGVDALIAQLTGARLTVNVLVNNAGVAPSGPLRKTTDAEYARVMAVNLEAPFRLMRALLPAMAQAGHGRVINIASTSALKGYRYTAAYSASKAGLLGLTRAAAVEFAAKGVCINAVCPTFTDTDIVGTAAEKIAEYTGRDRDEARASIASFSPQNRILDPSEVAAAVAYLASDDARGINGQALVIDGGETA